MRGRSRLVGMKGTVCARLCVCMCVRVVGLGKHVDERTRAKIGMRQRME